MIQVTAGQADFYHFDVGQRESIRRIISPSAGVTVRGSSFLEVRNEIPNCDKQLGACCARQQRFVITTTNLSERGRKE
jgi:hypothetical protein